VGVQHLDSLHDSQMAVQEASGVMWQPCLGNMGYARGAHLGGRSQGCYAGDGQGMVLGRGLGLVIIA